MTAYLADKAQAGVSPRFIEKGDFSITGTFTAAANFAVGDTITMFYAPPGVFLGGMQLDIVGVDGGTGFAVEVGQPGVPGQFVQGAKQSVAGTGYQGINQPGQLGYAFPAQVMPEVGYPVVVTVTTAATTPTGGGTIRLRAAMSADY